MPLYVTSPPSCTYQYFWICLNTVVQKKNDTCKNYSQNFLLLFIASWLLFLLGFYSSFVFLIPQHQIFLQSKKAEDFLNENLIRKNNF